MAVVFILPTRADAATLDDLTYEIIDGEVTITGCNESASGELVIPDTIDGYPVTGIGSQVFQFCWSLTSITIPDSVTSIGNFAFSFCSSLTSITIPDSVTSIGSNAFYYCSSLTSITIPDSVTGIGYSAFAGCSSLTCAIIGDSVTSIGTEAFYYCSSLSSIVFPASITQVGDDAFSGCTALADVYYTGTREQWDSFGVGINNDPLLHANVHFNYDPSVDICEHTYGDWVVTDLPTFTATGSQQKTCTQCGDVITDVVPIAVGKVEKWNITLQDALLVNLHLNISETIESTARVKVTVGDDILNLRAKDLEKTAEGLYVVSVELAAAQMADDIVVFVMDKNMVGSYANYTVRQYADAVLADESFSRYHDLVKEMLSYGAAAQAYFDYCADSPADEGITGAGQTEIPETADQEMSVSGAAEGVNFYAATLSYRDKIAVRFYFHFTGDINACTFTVNGEKLIPGLKNGLYYVDIPGILPEDLDQQITLTVTDANGNALTVSYSPMNYIVRMNEKGSDSLKALLKALYNYHLAAKALRAA